MRVITGFHAIEERIKKGGGRGGGALAVLYSKSGPRIKRILELCKASGVEARKAEEAELDSSVLSLPLGLREHRGIVLLDNSSQETSNMTDFDEWLALLPPYGRSLSDSSANALELYRNGHCIVVILDGITDEHNVGSIIRSCDQFGVSLVIVPERRGAVNIKGNGVIAKSSAGASEWVNIAVVKNLSRAVKALKDAGFWVYRADASGKRADKTDFAERTALVMGSEGSGVKRLVAENCDETVAIPTCGKIDSLNVSVAAGVLLYEIRRQWLVSGG